MNEQKELHEALNKNYTLNDIQEYVKKVIKIRGFENQPIEDEIILLTEEMGELAKAVRKEKTNMCIDKEKAKNYDPIEGEIADIFFVLTTICNTLNINLFDALYEKEKINITRTWTKDKNN